MQHVMRFLEKECMGAQVSPTQNDLTVLRSQRACVGRRHWCDRIDSKDVKTCFHTIPGARN